MAKATKKKDPSGKDKSKSKDNKKNKGKDANPGGGAITMVKDSWLEFKKIQWPTPKQAMNESVIVIVTVIFIIGLVSAYDWLANFLLGFII